MTMHDLKVWPEFFDDLRSGAKPFEVRRDDRGFQVGDLLRLREFDDARRLFTGREFCRPVTYVLRGGQFGLAEGFVVLGLASPEAERLRELIFAPELESFRDGVVLEAVHQVERWGSEHDAGKEPEDWLWLLGWLVGKAARAHREGDGRKAMHHCISSAAALANWHRAIAGASRLMRPGILPPAGFAE